MKINAHLAKLSEEEGDLERRKRLQRETLAAIHAFSAGDRLGREQVHERNAFPGRHVGVPEPARGRADWTG